MVRGSNVRSKKEKFKQQKKGAFGSIKKKKGDFYEKIDDSVDYSGGNFGYGGYFR